MFIRAHLRSLSAFLSQAEEFAGLGEGGFGNVFAGDHFGEFADAGVPFHALDGSGGFGAFDGFTNCQVTVGEGGDLGEMGDAEDLMDFGEVAEFFADDRAHAPAYVGVDFVEDQDTDAVGLGQY